MIEILQLELQNGMIFDNNNNNNDNNDNNNNNNNNNYLICITPECQRL